MKHFISTISLLLLLFSLAEGAWAQRVGSKNNLGSGKTAGAENTLAAGKTAGAENTLAAEKTAGFENTLGADLEGLMGADSLSFAFPEDVRSYGGFLIDMSLVRPEASSGGLVAPLGLPYLPSAALMMPLLSRNAFEQSLGLPNYSRLFALPTTSATYGRTSGTSSLWSAWSPTEGDLHSAQFKLNNGWRLNTQGQYNADGYRRVAPSALPWERNKFHGAFELKSPNGAFGIKVEVRRR